MRQGRKSKLKALMALVITLAMLFCMLPLNAFAQEHPQVPGPGNPNTSPGDGTIHFPEYDLTYTVTDGGSNLYVSVMHAGVTQTFDPDESGTFKYTVTAFGFTAILDILGNSLTSVTITHIPYICECECSMDCTCECEGVCEKDGGCGCDCECEIYICECDCGFICEFEICEIYLECKFCENDEDPKCTCDCDCDETGGNDGGDDPGDGTGGGINPGDGNNQGGGDNPGGDNDPGGNSGAVGGDGTGEDDSDGTGAGTGGGAGGGTGGDGGTPPGPAPGAAATVIPAVTPAVTPEDDLLTGINDPPTPLTPGPISDGEEDDDEDNDDGVEEDEDDDEPFIINITEPDIPLALLGDGKAWAVMNLVLSIAGAIQALMIGTHILMMKRRESEGLLGKGLDFRRFALALATPAFAISGLVLFILTQDMRLQMTLVDWWTPANAALFYGGTQCYIFAVRIGKDDDSDHDKPIMA